MRIASYNHMFGYNGRSLFNFLYVHALHKLKLYNYVVNRADLRRTIKTIREANADIIGITEILGENQRQKMIDMLKLVGYKYFHIGKGHGMDKKYGFVEILLATRIASYSVYCPDFDIPYEFGYGGGIVGIYIPDHNLYLIQLHLPLDKGKTKDSFRDHVQSILHEVKNMNTKSSNIILMGDFNCTYNDFMRFYPAFTQFTRLSVDEITCSTTNLLRWFYRKDLDHILGIGLKTKKAGVIEGFSDHKLVWADIEAE